MNKESGYQWKLGMFVIIGLVLFVTTIYFVGKQKNLFGSTFELNSKFNSVNGLEVGNNVRFSGINIGTVEEIEFLTDTSVVIKLIIKEEVRKYIKKDAIASISSDGLMGDKVLTISSGKNSNVIVENNDNIASKQAIEMDDLMVSVKKSVDNAGVITAQLAQFSYSMNNGNGALSKLVSDEEFGNSIKNMVSNLENSSNEFQKFTFKMNNGKGALSKLVSDEKMGRMIDSTLTNVKTGTEGLNEVIEAAKHNFLLRGYFNKKKKAEDKKLEELEDQEEIEMKKELNIGAKFDTIK
ncbi:MAG: MlaD family protein [Flavobacterium sp.]|jgi:phospholipid/cholesterol/gamma-HCH transport system substrate-binding protein|uniref:MlaD family protein n=1 Tax=unclassified Flavobacterium TaxID=196869 RepID=UPI000EAF5E98|nr:MULTISPECIES: MlaD family protein [unclassified Flavobacterium]MDI6049708.1 MlaD family protein [Flavobacterium sp. XS2P24]MDP3682233.1 MlaD family protein [Flavobacterium sp.]MDZ4329656.1 MlaD family protein [Flavobacterium sp.]RKS14390.1 phospholipid/cholesterol/gamma-HCH transport system substrate-binding protein [Flavobacterium sp. 120]